MKIHIKNMVCNRCIIAVNDIFKASGIEPLSVILGEVEIAGEMENEKNLQISQRLKEIGFEIIEDSKSRIIEKVKNVIIELVHYSEGEPRSNFSEIIESNLHLNYNYLSNLFSSVEGTTIENYIIHQKIEKVKELLVYNELNINEIAFRMGYSSAAHLSNQFKKVTGLTPSFFKEIGQSKRKTIDEVR